MFQTLKTSLFSKNLKVPTLSLLNYESKLFKGRLSFVVTKFIFLPETFEQQEVVLENVGVNDLLMGRALRDQIAMRLTSRRT